MSPEAAMAFALGVLVGLFIAAVAVRLTDSLNKSDHEKLDERAEVLLARWAASWDREPISHLAQYELVRDTDLWLSEVDGTPPPNRARR